MAAWCLGLGALCIYRFIIWSLMAVRKFFHKSTFNIHLDICYVIRFNFNIDPQLISFPFHLDI